MDLCGVALAWAVTVSGLKAPEDKCPTLERKSQAWLSQAACGSNKCPQILGWYPGTQGNIVYIDERLRPDESTYHYSIIIHELVHWLQGVNGLLGETTCEEYIKIERFAYNAQREFLYRYGMPASTIQLPVIVCRD